MAQAIKDISKIAAAVTERAIEDRGVKAPESQSLSILKGEFADAVRKYYTLLDKGTGEQAAIAVGKLADILLLEELSNAKVSELIKGVVPQDGGGRVTHFLLKGEPEGPPKAGGHPYKQHGAVWKRVALIEAFLKQRDANLKLPDNWAAPATWPDSFMIGGSEYKTPVEALADGQGLMVTSNMFLNRVAPKLVELKKFAIVDTVASVRDAARQSVKISPVTRSKTGDQPWRSKRFKATTKPGLLYGSLMGLAISAHALNSLTEGRTFMTKAQVENIVNALTEGKMPKDMDAVLTEVRKVAITSFNKEAGDDMEDTDE